MRLKDVPPAIVMILISALAAGQTGKPATRDYSSIMLDNIAYKEEGSDFADAFAQEPGCSGLSLILWTSVANMTADQQLHMWDSIGWTMLYNHDESGLGGGMIHRQPSGSGSFFDSSQRPSPTLFYSSPTIAGAVRKVCFIVKEKGGKVR